MNTEAAPACPFPYQGPQDLQETIVSALKQVVDPEVALSVVDLGLIYGVEVDDEAARVTMTMTSATCPVTEVIMDDVEFELERVLPAGCLVEVNIVWEPAWSPEMMSESARRFMG